MSLVLGQATSPAFSSGSSLGGLCPGRPLRHTLLCHARAVSLLGPGHASMGFSRRERCSRHALAPCPLHRTPLRLVAGKFEAGAPGVQPSSSAPPPSPASALHKFASVIGFLAIAWGLVYAWWRRAEVIGVLPVNFLGAPEALVVERAPAHARLEVVGSELPQAASAAEVSEAAPDNTQLLHVRVGGSRAPAAASAPLPASRPGVVTADALPSAPPPARSVRTRSALPSRVARSIWGASKALYNLPATVLDAVVPDTHIVRASAARASTVAPPAPAASLAPTPSWATTPLTARASAPTPPPSSADAQAALKMLDAVSVHGMPFAGFPGATSDDADARFWQEAFAANPGMLTKAPTPVPAAVTAAPAAASQQQPLVRPSSAAAVKAPARTPKASSVSVAAPAAAAGRFSSADVEACALVAIGVMVNAAVLLHVAASRRRHRADAAAESAIGTAKTLGQATRGASASRTSPAAEDGAGGAATTTLEVADAALATSPAATPMAAPVVAPLRSGSSASPAAHIPRTWARLLPQAAESVAPMADGSASPPPPPPPSPASLAAAAAANAAATAALLASPFASPKSLLPAPPRSPLAEWRRVLSLAAGAPPAVRHVEVEVLPNITVKVSMDQRDAEGQAGQWSPATITVTVDAWPVSPAAAFAVPPADASGAVAATAAVEVPQAVQQAAEAVDAASVAAAAVAAVAAPAEGAAPEESAPGDKVKEVVREAAEKVELAAVRQQGLRWVGEDAVEPSSRAALTQATVGSHGDEEDDENEVDLQAAAAVLYERSREANEHRAHSIRELLARHLSADATALTQVPHPRALPEVSDSMEQELPPDGAPQAAAHEVPRRLTAWQEERSAADLLQQVFMEAREDATAEAHMWEAQQASAAAAWEEAQQAAAATAATVAERVAEDMAGEAVAAGDQAVPAAAAWPVTQAQVSPVSPARQWRKQMEEMMSTPDDLEIIGAAALDEVVAAEQGVSSAAAAAAASKAAAAALGPPGHVSSARQRRMEMEALMSSEDRAEAAAAAGGAPSSHKQKQQQQQAEAVLAATRAAPARGGRTAAAMSALVAALAALRVKQAAVDEAALQPPVPAAERCAEDADADAARDQWLTDEDLGLAADEAFEAAEEAAERVPALVGLPDQGPVDEEEEEDRVGGSAAAPAAAQQEVLLAAAVLPAWERLELLPSLPPQESGDAHVNGDAPSIAAAAPAPLLLHTEVGLPAGPAPHALPTNISRAQRKKEILDMMSTPVAVPQAHVQWLKDEVAEVTSPLVAPVSAVVSPAPPAPVAPLPQYQWWAPAAATSAISARQRRQEMRDMMAIGGVPEVHQRAALSLQADSALPPLRAAVDVPTVAAPAPPPTPVSGPPPPPAGVSLAEKYGFARAVVTAAGSAAVAPDALSCALPAPAYTAVKRVEEVDGVTASNATLPRAAASAPPAPVLSLWDCVTPLEGVSGADARGAVILGEQCVDGLGGVSAADAENAAARARQAERHQEELWDLVAAHNASKAHAEGAAWSMAAEGPDEDEEVADGRDSEPEDEEEDDGFDGYAWAAEEEAEEDEDDGLDFDMDLDSDDDGVEGEAEEEYV